jgi:rhodanese-related sulfurtransferase
MSREDFVAMMTSDLAEAPQYFSHDAEMNRRGARPLDEIVASPLPVARVVTLLDAGAIPLDVRDNISFAAGHIPRSVNIGLDGQYASWCGTLLSPRERLVVVADGEERSCEAIMRLARVGMENVAGYVDRGILSWTAAGNPSEALPQMDIAELHDRQDALHVLDVRRPGEYAAGHVPVARNIPLSELPRRIREVPGDAPLAVICASGYRSAIASSLLRREGATNVINVIGGTSAWIRTGLEVATGGPTP